MTVSSDNPLTRFRVAMSDGSSLSVVPAEPAETVTVSPTEELRDGQELVCLLEGLGDRVKTLTKGRSAPASDGGEPGHGLSIATCDGSPLTMVPDEEGAYAVKTEGLPDLVVIHEGGGDKVTMVIDGHVKRPPERP